MVSGPVEPPLQFQHSERHPQKKDLHFYRMTAKNHDGGPDNEVLKRQFVTPKQAKQRLSKRDWQVVKAAMTDQKGGTIGKPSRKALKAVAHAGGTDSGT